MMVNNLNDIEENILNACKKVSRNRDDITIIAVSKTKPSSLIMEAYNLGIRDFGESKVPEFLEKTESLSKDINWHFVGHLQRNKVKKVIGRSCLIHSVDSYRLAEQISKESIKLNCDTNILIQVNVSEEDSKFGVSIDKAESLIRKVALLDRVHIKGLMTIAPYTSDSNENRKYFKKLKQLYVDIAKKNIDNIDMVELSMGMTGDYEVAIEEGATLVRIGTGIFGDRDYLWTGV